VRRCYDKIAPVTVQSLATEALSKALPWQAYGRLVTPAALLDLVLLASSLGLSPSACCSRFRFGFARETARKALAANLPKDIDALTEGILDALYSLLDPDLLKRRWDVAIDLHYCPFYGERDTEGILGGQKKQGTKYFYCYATAVLLHPRRRYTVGLIPVFKGDKPHQVVRRLLDQVASRGLLVGGVALDSGFDSGETILLLQDRHLSYVVPLRKKGKGGNRRNACFGLPVGTRTEVDWVTEDSRKAVQTTAVVLQRSAEEEVKVYAYGGWDDRRADWQAGKAEAASEEAERRRAGRARGKYRSRFGIETSYRQKNQAKAQTTKKDTVYRLLLEGVALLLRQVWVHLEGVIARARKLKRKAWQGELPLVRLVGWLADALREGYPEAKEIELGKAFPLPRGLRKKAEADAGQGPAGRRGRGAGRHPRPPFPPPFQTRNSWQVLSRSRLAFRSSTSIRAQSPQGKS